MKFIYSADPENFKVREGRGEVEIDEFYDRCGLFVDNEFFCFLNREQAKMIIKKLYNRNFEDFFYSVDIDSKTIKFVSKDDADINAKPRVLDPRFVPEDEENLYETIAGRCGS